MNSRKSGLDTLDEDIDHFLNSVYVHASPRQDEKSNYSRPYVTLTYAQSLDGKIAGKGNKQLRLSGVESMRMTHQLRVRHDGILVGIGTVLADDPQLTARGMNVEVERQPQPIIIDQHLKTPVTSRLVKNHQSGTGKQPWLYASMPINTNTVLALTNAGASVSFLPPSPHSSRLDLVKVLSDLHKRGVRSLMIEGGASIISSCLNLRMPDGRPLVDVVIVTVAPIIVGQDGIGISTPLDGQATTLQPITTRTFGNDSVFVCKLI